MTFIAIGTITLLGSWLLCWRRAVEQRAIRWDLYRKRDELRRLALDNPWLLDSDIFQTLDKQLTSHCAAFKHVSLWTLVPVLLMADRKKIEGLQRNFTAKLRQPRNSVMVPIYKSIVPLFARQLMWRHIFLTVGVAITIVGILVCYVTTKWLSERVISDAMHPIRVSPSLHEVT